MLVIANHLCYYLSSVASHSSGFCSLFNKLPSTFESQKSTDQHPASAIYYLCPPMNMNDDLMQRWWNLEAKLVERFGKKPDMEAILFLIGLNETGFLAEKITKEQKQDLMHVATCSLLAPSGFYVFEGRDEEGWPHYKQVKELPNLALPEQENFLRDHILLYFEQQGF